MTQEDTEHREPWPGMIIDEVSFTVERGKILEFARASHASDRIHTSPDEAARRGLSETAATATHVVAAGHHRSQADMLDRLGLNIARVVVGGTGWRYHRPLVAGDELTGTRVLVSDEAKTSRSGRRLRIITLNTDFRLANGTVAVSQRETLIERG
ncbi:FAS1-like dehydratase domain-containing protein [Brevibacterium aurantiacum]|uniref:Acyl dehydratase n=1 Tax=Brevibacterium aurantiacum TaxID=273384 RepID=A0A4Z0KEL4_BREAU|nr:MaoC family dehydratase N-terminal domain-containing protein [Brevibacterium aurantiacum]TGD37022.1 acyl dehydratase [Brevibacterium aurantiacum]